MARLFLDMDGVLADFDKAAGMVLGTPDIHKFEFVYGAIEFWRRLNTVPHFFAILEPMPDAWLLTDAVAHLKPMILTALPRDNGERVAQQKRDWIQTRLGIPTERVITCRTEEKPQFCKPGDILVDDRAVNKAAWERAGGRYIIHTSAGNTLEELRQMKVI